MEDTVFSPKEWQTAEIPSSLDPNGIDQVEDREMAGWNKRRTKVTGSFTGSWSCLQWLSVTCIAGRHL